MTYWLVKSEPTTYSIDDFERDRVTQWDAVRNYQARNFLREMKVRDEVLFYHSSAERVGVVGIGRVSRVAYPDKLQFDKKSDYFEPRATPEEPVWFGPDISFVRRIEPMIELPVLRKAAALKKMELLKRGSRLSVQPVRDSEFAAIMALAKRG